MAEDSNVIIGGKIVPWAAPRWRRALYRLGLQHHRRWLGDECRANELDHASRALGAIAQSFVDTIDLEERIMKLVAESGDSVDSKALLALLPPAHRVIATPLRARTHGKSPAPNTVEIFCGYGSCDKPPNHSGIHRCRCGRPVDKLVDEKTCGWHNQKMRGFFEAKEDQ